MGIPCPRAPLGRLAQALSTKSGHLSLLPSSQSTRDTRESDQMTDQPHQQGLGTEPLSKRTKAFMRGDLAHEYEDPEEHIPGGDMTTAEWAEAWGVSTEEVQRRFTRHRITNPTPYPRTGNTQKATEITDAATEGMWSDFVNHMAEGQQALNALPALPAYAAGVAVGWKGKKMLDKDKRRDDATEQLSPNGPTPPPPPER